VLPSSANRFPDPPGGSLPSAPCSAETGPVPRPYVHPLPARVAWLVVLGTLAPAADAIVVGVAPEPEELVEQGPAGLPASSEPATDDELVIVPSPRYSPGFGASLTLIGLYAYRPDPGQVKPWQAGAVVFGAQNQSWGALAFNRAILGDDRWRLDAAAGYLDVRYDYYGVGDTILRDHPLAIRQRIALAMARPLGRVADHLYLGPSLAWRSIHTTADAGQEQTVALDQALIGLGIAGEYDSRDGQFAPRSGWYIQGRVHSEHGSNLGIGPGSVPGPTYATSYLRVNRYQPLTTSSLLALRAATQFAGADAPFYDLPTLGGINKDLRGYNGEYRDHVLFATQAELRQELPARFGVVGFAGIGTVARTYADLPTVGFHPSLGAGLRYQVAPANRINAAFDAAWGDLGWAWYLSAGEAF
jgi:outer membrane protein assembly factor BamA